MSETTDLSPAEQSMAALEACFALIANASFPISKHDEVRACLSFLDTLHSKVKSESEGVTNE